MRSLILISTLLLFLSLACTTTGDTLTSPTDPALQESGNGVDEYVYECRANMRVIAGEAVIFFAYNNRYPTDLEEMGMAELTCSECGLPYNYYSNSDEEYFVGCPIPDESNHGFIENGVASWSGEPEEWDDQCHSMMYTLFCGCVMYFAENSCYPSDQSSMDEPYCSMVCPECETPYGFRGDEENFVITCPMPELPNHGQIVNGVPTWDEEIDICRANMITIAGQCFIFFACNSRYPDNLEEMGMEYFICPTCMSSYTYYLYENSAKFYDFFIGCPIPEGPNHGCIDAGIASWHE